MGDDSEKEKRKALAPKTINEIINCLKKILKTAKELNKDEKRQGYLEHISQFIR